MAGMTFPTVIETPLHLEPVTRDPFGDEPFHEVAVPPTGELVLPRRSGRAATERR
jgi:hypothetical protein